MAQRVKVIDLGLKEVLHNLASLDGWGVSTGVHEDDSGRNDDEVGNANLYAIHEFGAGRIPERSSLRTAFDANVDSYFKLMAFGAGKVLDGTAKPQAAVAIVGERSTADTVEGIRKGIPPPNAPFTVARKGSSTPLIDTGQLVQAIKPKTGKDLK